MVRLAAWWSVGLLLFPTCVRAEVPSLDFIFPAGAQSGTTNTVTIGGKFEPWPPKIWIDCPGFLFVPQTNKGTFKVVIETTVPAGPHLLRLFNSDGSSTPKSFVIGNEQETLEVEPNDSWKQAQRIDRLPAILNGRLEKGGDVDSFAVRLEAGKWLIAMIDGYALGSPIDPNLALFDESGERIAFNSDSRQSLDPLLEWKVARSGTYILQVSAFAHPPAADVRLAGSPAAVYRLSISEGPFANAVFPASVPRGCKTEVEVTGHNLSAGSNTRWPVEPESSDTTSFLWVTNSGRKLRVAVSRFPQQVEHEPNNSSAQAELLHWPATINGKIDPAGDEDRFVFDSKRDEKLEFRLRSGALGLPLDATIRVEDVNGKQVMRDDDSGEASDPLLLWTTPSNGTYRAVISDLYRRGGPEFAYALDVSVPVPEFKVTADSSSYRIEPGKTNEIKLIINRLATHTNKLETTILGLPNGISFKSGPISGKDKDTKVSLIAAPEAKPFSGPFRIEVKDALNKSLSHRAIFPLRPKESAFGEMLISQTDQLWLTVTTNVVASEKPKSK